MIFDSWRPLGEPLEALIGRLESLSSLLEGVLDRLEAILRHLGCIFLVARVWGSGRETQ